MQGDFVVNTIKMREQADFYLAEKQLSDQLLEELRRAEHLSPADSEEYQDLEKEVQELSVFYSRMSAATKQISEDVEKASLKIREKFEENVYGK